MSHYGFIYAVCIILCGGFRLTQLNRDKKISCFPLNNYSVTQVYCYFYTRFSFKLYTFTRCLVLFFNPNCGIIYQMKLLL